MNLLKLFPVLLAAASLCAAETIHVSGTVTDTAGAPLSGAFVGLENGGPTATTGSDGKFALAGTAILNRPGELQALSATIKHGLLYVNLPEKSAVEITTYNLEGRAISTLHELLASGSHSTLLPGSGAGVFLYKVKSGGRQVLLRSASVEGPFGRGVSVQGLQGASAKRTRAAAAISDVIAVTKAGYLDYREILGNSDTSGIVIKMIVCEDSVADTDGNVYQAVKIGDQVWTVKNLKTTRYNDGSAIPEVTDDASWANLTTAGYCWYNNDSATNSYYGALYNWYSVGTGRLAPAGWHVPTDSEWSVLENYLVAKGYNWDGTTASDRIAKSLAGRTDWFTAKDSGVIGNDLTQNNRSGFSALPGGYRGLDGNVYDIGGNGGWWTTSENGTSNGYTRGLVYVGDHLLSVISSKSTGQSVRLVKNQ